jgi:glycosyltransferase involved in cell wall biosynthesis
MKNILILGPRFHHSGKVGGVVVLFELFLEELDRAGIKYEVIDTNKKNYKNKISAIVLIFIKFCLMIQKFDKITIHGTAADFKYLVPFFVCICRLFDKSVFLRKFAGSFSDVYKRSGFLQRKLIAYSLKSSSANFFETKYLVDYFRQFNDYTFWFPNVRKSASCKVNSHFKKRFIFLGHICKDKGVYDLVAAASRLHSDYEISLYGDLEDPDLEKYIENSRVEYGGRLTPKNVTPTLCKHDVLVLPTCWVAEGYPGVIIEAFSVGLPVISTSLEGIKELVCDGHNGRLIAPGNVSELVQAIESFSQDNYPLFVENSIKSFDVFESSKSTDTFISIIKDLK